MSSKVIIVVLMIGSMWGTNDDSNEDETGNGSVGRGEDTDDTSSNCK